MWGAIPRLRKAQETFSAKQFGDLVERTAIVGEIGLDMGARVPLTQQLDTFRKALAVLVACPRIVSVHSFRATGLEGRDISGVVRQAP